MKSTLSPQTYTWASMPAPVAQGWQCPICHIVYAPTVGACYCAHHALANIQMSTSTSVTPPLVPHG